MCATHSVPRACGQCVLIRVRGFPTKYHGLQFWGSCGRRKCILSQLEQKAGERDTDFDDPQWVRRSQMLKATRSTAVNVARNG